MFFYYFWSRYVEQKHAVTKIKKIDQNMSNVKIDRCLSEHALNKLCEGNTATNLIKGL